MKGNKLYHGYSEDLIFESEEDKQRILSMKDVEREKIIAERIEKLNFKKERETLLNENQIKNNDNNKKINNRDSSPLSDSEESGEIPNDNKSRNKRKKTNNSDGDNDSILSMDNEDDKQAKKETPTISLEEIEKVKLTREFFFKYYNYPIFNENVKGAFVRINLSNSGIENPYFYYSGYIIGAIENIITQDDKPYDFMGDKCTKYVLIKENGKIYSFKVISNSKILEDELSKWCKDNKIPTTEEIAQIQKNIEAIKTHKLSVEELNKILNQKKKDRIKYKDSTLNITEELDLAIEKYRYNKEKCEEEEEKEKKKKPNEKNKYSSIMKEIEQDIKLLEKMKEERDKKAKMNSDNDIVAKINEDIRKRQKLDEKKSLLMKKRKNEQKDTSEHKIFKRVDCHPSTLFDTKNFEKDKKDLDKEIKEKTENKKEKIKKKNNTNFCYAQKIKQFKEHITEKKILIDEMMKYEKLKKNEKDIGLEEKEKENNEKIKEEKKDKSIDMSLFFKLASINYEVYNKMIKDENKKNTLDPQVKIIGLSEYLKENNKK